MSTTQDLITEVRRYLSDPLGMRNKVDTHIAGQVSFVYPLKGIQDGTRFSAGLQTFYVWEVNESTKTAMVDVVQGPSTLMPSHTTVYVSPRHTGYDILAAANDALTALSARGLYQMKAVEIPYNYTLVGYDMSSVTDIDDIYEVLQSSPGPFKDWTRKHPSHYRLQRNADTTDFSGGLALNVWQGGFQGFPMRIIYKAPFTQLTNLTDDVAATSGLPATAIDLLALGTAINIMSGKEIARNLTDVQGDTRRAGEVPAGAVANSISGLRVLYQQRLQDEIARISRRYPSYRAG